jgi:O-methyltransferase
MTSLPILRKFQHFTHHAVAAFGYGLTRLSFPTKVARLKLVKQIQKNRLMLITTTEAWQISAMVESVRRIPGDMAEVGTFQGASAALIASSDPSKVLHVFDTFDGLPEVSAADQGKWAFAGNFTSAPEEVMAYLGQWPSIRVHKGIFPESASDLGDLRFSFVHLDMDLYEGTLAALKWFYPRMAPGGILVTHDFNFCSGVNRAFHEFFADKPEPMMELATNQCLFVKLHHC